MIYFYKYNLIFKVLPSLKISILYIIYDGDKMVKFLWNNKILHIIVKIIYKKKLSFFILQKCNNYFLIIIYFKKWV